MIKNPNIRNGIKPYIICNPIGVDIIVKELQNSFDKNLSWKNTSFNRAQTMTKLNNDGGEEVFPKLWVNDGNDEINALGLDRFSSYSFFHSPDSETLFGDYSISENRYERDLNIYFWFNLSKVDNSRSDDFRPELVQEIKQVINKTFCNYGEFRISNVILNEPDIYKDFSIDITDKQSLYHPYRGVKFELETIYYDVNCI